MKKLSIILSFLMLCFAGIARGEDKCSREMLDQVSNFNSSYRPLMKNPQYEYKKKDMSIVILRMYDGSRYEVKPETADIQAIFIKRNKVCALAAIVFSPINIIPYIDILTEITHE
jgi:hypothetical protein